MFAWQTELNLLKKLHHQNIVEYKETIQSENALCVSSSHTQGATTPCSFALTYVVLNNLCLSSWKPLSVNAWCRERGGGCCCACACACCPWPAALGLLTGCMCTDADIVCVPALCTPLSIDAHACRYIVLEFVENGSLAQMLKRFGSFPETLTAVYVCQVLNGLAFLHKQGVIHRDIKVGLGAAAPHNLHFVWAGWRCTPVCSRHGELVHNLHFVWAGGGGGAVM